jgi:uncharacterized protein (TIGR04255 family)
MTLASAAPDHATPDQPYARPPVIEAAIELRYADLLDGATVDKAVARLKRDFPKAEQLSSVALRIDADQGAGNASVRTEGFKLTAPLGTDILMAQMNGLTVVRQPPYPGWPHFAAHARDVWTTWKSIVGYHRIGRLGVRYINRIDIPATAAIALEDYFRFNPQIPDGLPTPIDSVFSRITADIPTEQLSLALILATAQPALVGHHSFVLDIDLGRTIDPPQKDDDIWAALEAMRTRKNAVFETTLTDRTKAFFA